MADAEVKPHDTKYLDRHGDYIRVYERTPSNGSRVRIVELTDGGEAVEDLLLRTPDTAKPQEVVPLIGRVMEVAEAADCYLCPDMSIADKVFLFAEPDDDDRQYIAERVDAVAQAYLAVERIDVEGGVGMQSDTGTNLISHIYHHRCRCGRITWEEETGGDFPTSKGWYLKWPVDPVEPGEFCCVCGCRLEADGTALDVLGSLVACQAALEEAMGALWDKDPRNPNS